MSDSNYNNTSARTDSEVYNPSNLTLFKTRNPLGNISYILNFNLTSKFIEKRSKWAEQALE